MFDDEQLSSEQSALARVLDHQIHLGIEAIFSATLAGRDPFKISFHHILNRVMMILQLQVNFAVLKRDEDKYKLVYLSNTDFDHSHKIKNYVDKTISDKFVDISINNSVFLSKNKDFFDDLNSESSCAQTIRKKINDVFYPILGEKTDYLLGVLKCIKVDGDYNFEWIYKIEKIQDIKNGWDCAGYKLNEIFKFERYDCYGAKFVDAIDMALSRYEIADGSKDDSMSFWEDAVFKDKKIMENFTQNKEEIREYFDRIFLNDFNSVGYKISGKSILDNGYKKYEPNAFLVGKDDNPLTNFFFLTRHYVDKDYKRYEKKSKIKKHKDKDLYYNYAVRVAICSSQREDFRKFFSHLCGVESLYEQEITASNYKKNIEIYLEKSFGEDNSDGNIERINLLKIVDACFLLMHTICNLKKGEACKKDGIDLIIDLIGMDLTKYTKSITDGVFKDGVSYYRNPFRSDLALSRSGLKSEDVVLYIKNNNGLFSTYIKNADSFNDLMKDIYKKSKIEQQIFDFFRAFLCRIIFDGMSKPIASDNNQEQENYELYIMMNPIEVGAKVFGVATYLTRSRNPDAEFLDVDDVLRFNSYWLQNYHIFESINNRFKKSLRVDMEIHYVRAIGNLYEKKLDKMYKDEFFNIKEFVSEYKILSLFFPYGHMYIRDNREICAAKYKGIGLLPNDTYKNIAMLVPQASLELIVPDGDNLIDRCSPFSVITGYEHSKSYQFVDIENIAMSMSDRVIHTMLSHSMQHQEEEK